MQKIQFVLILIVAAVVGFRAYQAIPDRVGWDFVRFNNAALVPALNLMPNSRRFLAAKTDSEMAEAYAVDFVPIYAEKIQRLEAFHPKTREVQRLRQLYLDSFHATLQGYLDFTQAVQVKDPAKRASSDRELAEGLAKIALARQYGLAIIKAHHLQFDTNKRKK